MQAVLSLTILVASCACAFALDPSLDISQYAHTSWKVRDGFAKGAPNALAQTQDGYLWVGTESGLLRFDGIRPVYWQSPSGQQLPGTLITSLLVAQDGTLWIGTFTGLANLKDGRLTEFPDLRDRAITSLFQARDGTVWMGVYAEPDGGVCKIKNGVVRCELDSQRFGNGVMGLYEDHEGSLWLGTHRGLWRWGRYSQFFEEASGITSFAEDEQGQPMFSGDSGIHRLVNSRIQPYSSSGSTYKWRVRHMLRDHDGGLWIGTAGHGLAHINKLGRTDLFSSADGLSGDSVTQLYEDREGSIWVATLDGIDRFREYSAVTISAKQGVSTSAVSVLPARDGSLWISTLGGLNHYKDGKVFLVGCQKGALNSDGKIEGDPPLGPLFEDASGRIFISTANTLRYLEKGRCLHVPGIPLGAIPRAMAEASPNGLWVTTQRAGLFRVFNGTVVQQIPWSGLGRRDYASFITADHSQGGFWLAFHNGGIAYFKDGTIRASYSDRDGLGKGAVTDLRFGADGVLWAATEGGLSRIKDGRATTLSGRNGLPCDRVVASIEDTDHSAWLSMGCGLVRITERELNAWVSDPGRVLRTTIFDSFDGVRSHAATGAFQPLMTKSADGRIWFLPWDGVSVIDPHNLHENKLAPPVHIEKIVADDKTYDEPGNGVRLATGVRYVTIDYTALSLVAPEKVHFRYKLEGQDKDWREVVNDREVQYSNLAPKRYRFRVLASNNSGVWNEDGAAVEFVIPPAWYQTNWFYAGCVAAFLGMVWGVYELRVRQMAAEFNVRMEERLAERTRIARDLHDTLLQSFQGLVFRFQAARNQLPGRPEKAEEVLDGALEAADKALAEGRGAIQELRKAASEENNLEQMLLVLGRELELSRDGGGAPPLRVIVEGSRRAKRTIVREEVYRIARELLRNAYKHAHAKNIEAELRYEEDAFLLVVRDDGKGIDPEVLKDRGRAGHWGLPGMYERAEGIGAKLDIWSEAGAGTEVRLTVPAAIAYEKPGKGGRSTSLGKTRIYEHRP